MFKFKKIHKWTHCRFNLNHLNLKTCTTFQGIASRRYRIVNFPKIFHKKRLSTNRYKFCNKWPSEQWKATTFCDYRKQVEFPTNCINKIIWSFGFQFDLFCDKKIAQVGSEIILNFNQPKQPNWFHSIFIFIFSAEFAINCGNTKGLSFYRNVAKFIYLYIV